MAERLRLQVMLDAVEKVSGPLKRIMSGAGGATSALKATSAELAGMKRLSGDITNYQRLRTELRGVARSMDDARDRTAAAAATATQLRTDHHALAGEVRAARAVMKLHSNELAAAKKPSAALTAAYNAQKAKLAELEQRYNQSATSLRAANRAVREGEQATTRLTQRERALSGQLEQTRQKLDKAGVSTAQMAGRQRALRSEVAQTTSRLDQQRKQLERMQVIQQRAKAMHSGGMTAMMHGAGAMYAGQRMGSGMVGAAMPAIDLQAQVRDIGITAGFSDAQEAALQARLRADALAFGQFAEKIGEGLGVLTANGITGMDQLAQYSPVLAKVSVAANAEMADLGQLIVSLEQMKVPTAEMTGALDALSYAGKEGSFELADMARWFPQLGPMMKGLGITGRDAVNQLGAALQIARLGAGTNDEAANNLKNYLGKITAPDTIKHFDDAGIDLRARLVDLQKRGIGPLEGSLQLITDYMGTKGPEAAAKFKDAISLEDAEQRAAALEALGNSFSLGELFRDMQAMSFIRPALANRDQMRGIRDGAASATGGIDADWARRMESTSKKLDLFKIQWADLKVELGQQLMPLLAQAAAVGGRAFAWATDFARDNPHITRGLAVMGAGLSFLLVTLGGLLTAGGMAAMGFSQIYKAVGLIANSGALSGVPGIFAKLSRFLPSVASGARMLLPVLGGISWPVLAIGAAVAVVAALVWRYWEPIKAFAVGVWQGVAETGGKALAELSAALAPLAPAWATLTGWIGAAWDWFSKLLVPVASTSEELQNATSYGRMFGEAILGNLRLVIAVVGWVVTGFSWLGQTIGNTIGFVVTGLGHLWDAITGLFRGDWGQVVAALRGGWANVDMFLGGLPARFMAWGADMIQGLVNGIVSRVPLIGDALKNGITASVTWFKDFLGIKSPSRLFAEFGGFTMQGYAMGLNREGNAPLQAIAGVGQRVRIAGAGLAMATAAAPAMAAAGVPAAAAAAPAHYEIHIHTTAGQDPQAIARAVAAELDRRESARRAGMRSRFSDTD